MLCPVIDHKFSSQHHQIAVDPQGDSPVDPQTALTMLLSATTFTVNDWADT